MAGKKTSTSTAAAKTGYYEFLGGQLVPISGNRPTNQNSRSVQRKSAQAVDKYVAVTARRQTTKDFMQGVKTKQQLSKMGTVGLHMAHGVSAQELKTAIAALVNRSDAAPSAQARQKIQQSATKFVEDFASSDDDEDATLPPAQLQKVKKSNVKLRADRLKTKETMKRALAKSASKSEREAAANRVLERLNRVSRNLVGGDPATNMKIGKRRDVARDTSGSPLVHMDKRRKVMDKLIADTQLNQSGEFNQFKSLVESGSEVSSTF